MDNIILFFEAIYPYLAIWALYCVFGYFLQRQTSIIGKFLEGIIVAGSSYWVITFFPPLALYMGISMILGVICGYLVTELSPRYFL